jgi:hypothetical protein
MDTSNIRGTGAVYIAKDSLDNNQQAPLLKRPLSAQADDGQAKLNVIFEQQKLVIGNPDVFQRADSYKQSSTYDDNPNLRIRKELELYQSIGSQEKREDITQLLGVDIYA